MEKITKENKEMNETLRRLREDATGSILDYYKARIPKKPTDMHTKLQMKKMVEDLENEVGKYNYRGKKKILLDRPQLHSRGLFQVTYWSR